MAETINIAEVASKVWKEVFKPFGWHAHPRQDDNFSCGDPNHQGKNEKSKKTHPTDVVFSYQDPYSGRRIHILTDLKSYKADSITNLKIRSALQSLAMATECAQESAEWREKYSVDVEELNEVRGMLFVHNHDGAYAKKFHQEMRKVNVRTLEIRADVILHFLGPEDITRLFNVANDVLRLIAGGDLPKEYTFYYPDLVMTRRIGGLWEQQATFEVLAGPFMIIKHESCDGCPAGYLIYYNRSGASVEEFEYLIDCFSRYQILDSEMGIRIRVVANDVDDGYKSKFHSACNKYVKSWGFDQTRAENLSKVTIDKINAVSAAYDPGDCAWRV
ncbi:hypothetical protein [Pseudoxanthomonas sp. UC19_8]|uniref:hypothetical protein n=1 Tax=Pseudoxanthomonas sp. UC19_8 TaxID=3350175 RepID=UPI0036D2F3B6